MSKINVIDFKEIETQEFEKKSKRNNNAVKYGTQEERRCNRKNTRQKKGHA